MQLQGKCIYATSALNESIFENAVIFIVEHNASGALGFIVNRSFERSLSDLEEFKHIRHFSLSYGGPMDNEHLYFIHRRNDLVKDSTLVFDEIFFSGNFQQALTSFNEGVMNEQQLKIFIGYCGWDTNELESEIEEGSWTIAEADSDLIFKQHS